jgi:cytochrome c
MKPLSITLVRTLATGAFTIAAIAAPAASAQTAAPTDLLKSKNCMGCHDTDKKKVGPAFKDTAAKYKDNKDAEAKIIAALKEGKGHPMKVTATDAELKTLVGYVLSLK